MGAEGTATTMRTAILLALAPLAMAFAPTLAPGAGVRANLAISRGASPVRPTFSVRPAAALLQMGKGIDFPLVDGTDMRIGIVTTRWNSEVVSKLKDGARKTLIDAGFMALTQKVDAIVPMGVLIKGDTDHYDMIKDAATAGLMDLQLTTGVPVLCGILGCHTMEQAEERATGDFNHGVWWAKTAIEMATLRSTQMGKTSSKKSVVFGAFTEEDMAKSPSVQDGKKQGAGFF